MNLNMATRVGEMVTETAFHTKIKHIIKMCPWFMRDLLRSSK